MVLTATALECVVGYFFLLTLVDMKRQHLSGEQPQQRASISIWPTYFCV
jgi:hypothetical protein